MDNVTHSLAGLVVAEAASRLRARRSGAEPSSRFRAVAAISSMLAANLPDADLLYTGVGGDRIAYMLHHRGHTHTVVIALLGALLVWGVAWLALRARAREEPPRHEARWLLGLLVVSMLSHLVLDWTNSYGVHPFWPFDDRWFYGDSVFIVEPWLWVVAVPALFAATRRRVARLLLSLVLLAGLALSWRVDQVTRGAAAVLTVGAILSAAIAWRLRPGARIAFAIGGWVAVTLAMAAGASLVRRDVVRAVRAGAPGGELLDVVVSPLPANAVCMSVIAVWRSGPRYHLTTGSASSVPALGDAASCGRTRGPGPATFGAPSLTSSATVAWAMDWSGPAAELAELARASCPALAALRFIRVPVWRAVDDSTVILGDARYGGGEDGFSTVRVPRRSTACPPRLPPWTPPRADLLGL